MTVYSSKRLFFAIWPQAEVRECLRQSRSMFCPPVGRWIPTEKLHMTLVFLGNVAVERIPEVEAAASKVATAPFRMQLDRLRPAPAKGMIWLVPTIIPQELMGLESLLKSSLEAVDIEVEKRPYRPHITLIRKLPAPFDPCEIEAVDWPVGSFALVESRQSQGASDYIRCRIWQLRG